MLVVIVVHLLCPRRTRRFPTHMGCRRNAVSPLAHASPSSPGWDAISPPHCCHCCRHCAAISAVTYPPCLPNVDPGLDRQRVWLQQLSTLPSPFSVCCRRNAALAQARALPLSTGWNVIHPPCPCCCCSHCAVNSAVARLRYPPDTDPRYVR